MTFEEKIIAGVILGLSVPLAIWVAKKIFYYLNTINTTVTIIFKDNIPSNDTKYYLRHVRDGKDELDEKGRLENKDIPIIINGRYGTGKAIVRHQRKIGFQYKCYVDIGMLDELDVRNSLIRNGFIKLSFDEALKNRIWFILPDKPECKSVDEYENNYFHSNK